MKLFHLASASALLATFLAAAPTRANDASFIGVAGSPTLAGGEHRAIRMESERVILTPRGADKFATDARFVFVNDSDRAQTVQMGFPETNGGDGEELLEGKSGFEKFSTTVNGRAVAAKRTVLTAPAKEGDVWWIKTVNFAPRECVNVRVMTLSPLGGSVDWAFGRALSYNFTGGNWKGLVSRSDLEVRVPQRGHYAAVGSAYDGGASYNYWKPSVTREGETVVLRKTWRDWQAQSEVQVGIKRVMPGWLLEIDSNRVPLDVRTLPQMASFGVGAPQSAPVGSNIHAFVRDGVTMVSFEHLAARAADLLPDGANRTTWDAAKKRAVLSRGAGTLAFAVGNKTMTVNGTTPVALRAAPVMVSREYGGQSLYVPLAPAARALGLTVQVDAAGHSFSVGK